MLQLQRSFDWSQIINFQTHPDALELLLTKRPDLATRAFGEDQRTLLLAVGRGTASDVENVTHLCRTLLRYGADPSAQDADRQTPLDYFPRLKELLISNTC